MKDAFRQSMAWLHTWVGLVAGWLLFFVFVTGTAGYFQQEISRWMQPERMVTVAAAEVDRTILTDRAIEFADNDFRLRTKVIRVSFDEGFSGAHDNTLRHENSLVRLSTKSDQNQAQLS